jgi:hypothetical protein
MADDAQRIFELDKEVAVLRERLAGNDKALSLAQTVNAAHALATGALARSNMALVLTAIGILVGIMISLFKK